MNLPQTHWNGEAFARAIPSAPDHLSLAERFVEEWFPPIQPQERVPESDLEIAERRLGRRFPLALGRWFKLLGGRELLMSGNGDDPRMPSELEISDGVLELIRESQSVWRLGLRDQDLQLPDPPVWMYEAENYDMWSKGLVLTPKFSTFVLLWAMNCVRYEAPFTAETLDDVDITRLLAQFPRLDLPHWRLYGECDFASYAGEDLLIQVAGLKENRATWVWLSARNEAARDRAAGLVDGDWDLQDP